MEPRLASLVSVEPMEGTNLNVCSHSHCLQRESWIPRDRGHPLEVDSQKGRVPQGENWAFKSFILWVSSDDQWNPDSSGLALGDVSQTWDLGQIPRSLTLKLMMKTSHCSFHELKLWPALQLSLRSEYLGYISRLSWRSKGQTHLAENKLEGVLGFDSRWSSRSPQLESLCSSIPQLWTLNAAFHNGKRAGFGALPWERISHQGSVTYSYELQSPHL